MSSDSQPKDNKLELRVTPIYREIQEKKPDRGGYEQPEQTPTTANTDSKHQQINDKTKEKPDEKTINNGKERKPSEINIYLQILSLQFTHRIKQTNERSKKQDTNLSKSMKQTDKQTRRLR